MRFDVVIIGASSAGLYAAEILSRNGKRVAILEKQKVIASDPRTYIITPGLFRAVPDFDRDLIRQELNSIQIQAGNQVSEIQLVSPDLVIDRKQLIQYFLQRAKSAGVEIFTDSQFLGLSSDHTLPTLEVSIQDEDGYIEVDYLIGADGIKSQVRKSFFSQEISSAPLLQAEIDLPADWNDNIAKVWFDVEDTSYFYWLIPDKNRTAVVGLIADDIVDIKQNLDDFLKIHNFLAKSYQSGLVALHQPGIEVEARVSDLKVFLAGDAAGQVKVTTVGGTVTGLFGGKAAAEAILSGSTYKGRLRTAHRELDLHYFIRTMLKKMSAADYERMIKSITPPVQNLLSSHDRDSMGAHFWKLPILQPGFIPLGLKLLLKQTIPGI